MESEFVQRDVAGVAAGSVGIGGKAVDDGPVGEPDFQLLDQRAFEKGGLAGPSQNPAGLNVFLDLFHQQTRLPLALGKENPGGLSFQAFQEGADGSGKGIADLASFHHDLERRIILNPAALVGK